MFITQTQVYPLKDRAKAFCRGFKTFHPFVEVAKEGLKRPGITSIQREQYNEIIASANPSKEEKLEQMNERLFSAKIFFAVSCMVESVAMSISPMIFENSIPMAQKDEQTLQFYLCAMGGIAASIFLGYMRNVSDFFQGVKPFYFLKKIWAGTCGIISTSLSIGIINSLYESARSLSSNGISPFKMFTFGRPLISMGIAATLAAISVKCILSVFRTTLPTETSQVFEYEKKT